MLHSWNQFWYGTPPVTHHVPGLVSIRHAINNVNSGAAPSDDSEDIWDSGSVSDFERRMRTDSKEVRHASRRRQAEVKARRLALIQARREKPKLKYRRPDPELDPIGYRDDSEDPMNSTSVSDFERRMQGESYEVRHPDRLQRPRHGGTNLIIEHEYGYDEPEIGDELDDGDDEHYENFEQQGTVDGNIYPDIPIDEAPEEKKMDVPRIEIQPESKEESHLEHQLLHSAIMQESVPGDNVPTDVVGLGMPEDPIHPDLQGGNNVAPILAPVAPRLARARDKVAVLVAASLALASKHKHPLQYAAAASTGLAMGMAYAWAYEKTAEEPKEPKKPAMAVHPETESTYDPTHVDGGNEMFSYRPIHVQAPPPKVSKYVPKHKRVIGAMDRMVAGLSGVQPWMKASKYKIPMQKVEKRPLANFKLLAMQKKKRKK
jgi:hypothetical protein